MILLAQTREADQERMLAIADAEQREAIARDSLARQDAAAAQTEQLRLLLESNATLMAEVERLMRKIHRRLLNDTRGVAGAGR